MSTPLEINTINLANIDDFFTIPPLDNSVNIYIDTQVHYDGYEGNSLSKVYNYNIITNIITPQI